MTRAEEDAVIARRVTDHAIPDGYDEACVLMVGSNGSAVSVRPRDLLHALRVEQVTPPIGFTR